jgi:hypothetical protein
MTISALLGRCALGAAAVLAGLAFAGAAQAVPVYTYTFTQGGYDPLNPSFPGVGSVTGSFSGTVDSGGHITRDTLTAYHFETSGFNLALFPTAATYNTPPALFSYIPGNTSSFALIEPLFTAGGYWWTACIGLPASFACNGGATALGAVTFSLGQVTEYPFTNSLLAFTASAPVLMGSVEDVGTPVYLTAVTPIPASLALFLTGFGSLSLIAAFRPRARQSESAA